MVERALLDFYAQLESIARQRRDRVLSDARPVKPRPGDEPDGPAPQSR